MPAMNLPNQKETLTLKWNWPEKQIISIVIKDKFLMDLLLPRESFKEGELAASPSRRARTLLVILWNRLGKTSFSGSKFAFSWGRSSKYCI